MRFCIYLNESDKIIKSIVAGVYEEVFSDKNKTSKDIDGSYQCHTSVNFIKNNYKDFWWYKDLKFYQWNESKWEQVSDKLKVSKVKFSNKNITNLIEDIIDFSVNGHSFLSYKGYFIDPYLKSLKVPEKMIQNFDQYFLKIMRDK